ncbi:MAG: TrpB-like pyridoxal-phosphate dependent enzyme, partial [Candidatus Bathyarchaeota archaeon]|nr:TrpB-like pyridoxal-phosphate dependent enzyme [Candidatus Bathyarchaeota archaeon]
PTLSLLVKEGVVEKAAYSQEEVLDAAKIFTKTEGIVPAPETAHAIKQVIVEALKCKQNNTKKTIVFCFSGHGLLDLPAYEP